MAETTGIIIFALWYIAIAFNYLIAPVMERRRRSGCRCMRAPCPSTSNSCDRISPGDGSKSVLDNLQIPVPELPEVPEIPDPEDLQIPVPELPELPEPEDLQIPVPDEPEAIDTEALADD
ncbi:uncharacterized protein LOC111362333 isoform X2 [Spodoptera litura]|nr:uncharacterized protein LOC111362333 isoform X2 [Spodoptera litura]XP_022834767.1 uncharacterized protein LOC111362333 isoform X2 [Spodoptera litura]XP_022834768.1 uncharacterized protein LOC111362333 isoform X2 [Spodoptera litura]